VSHSGLPPITLVLFPGALGDLVCFLPTIAALRRRHAERPLAVVVTDALRSLVVRDGIADAASALEDARVARWFVRDAPVEPLLPSHRVADVYSWFASGDPIVRDSLGRLADGTVSCVPFAVPADWARHAVAYYLAGAGAGRAGRPPAPRIALGDQERARADGFWRDHDLAGRAVLALHRGAGSPRKRWADDGHAAVASWWRGRDGAVVEVVGPADPPHPLHERHVVAQGLPLGDVAALLARAALFLGGDSGVSHLAGAVGAVGVAVFGPTSARIWRPLGGRIVSLRGRTVGTADAPITLDALPSARVIRALEILRARP
jgi:ADP-heptose:LPS heptosyltransferase